MPKSRLDVSNSALPLGVKVPKTTLETALENTTDALVRRLAGKGIGARSSTPPPSGNSAADGTRGAKELKTFTQAGKAHAAKTAEIRTIMDRSSSVMKATNQSGLDLIKRSRGGR